MLNHKYPYNWKLKDANFTKNKGTVFSCFSCGGGSTMGYKLAGFDIIGCNEIDKRMMYVYCQNHDPEFSYLEPIQDFKKRKNLPPELYNLDILDGSPPCSTFSISGSREAAWGIEKKFKEGQSKQILDTLFFDFIDLAERLQPKIVVGENVKGLLVGNARKYVSKIYDSFDKAGYYCQHWLLDSQNMGVPQRRERVFFVCLRKDLAEQFLYQHNFFEKKPALDLVFKEATIFFNEIADYSGREVNSPVLRTLWDNRKDGDSDQANANMRLYGKNNNFNQAYAYLDKVCPTLSSKESCLIHYNQPRYLGKSEVCGISSFPQDYNFAGQSAHYICGMSVPPLMVAQIATRIWEQWISNIYKQTY